MDQRDGTNDGKKRDYGGSKYGTKYREIAEELFGRGNSDIQGLSTKELATAESQLGLHLPTALSEYYLELGAFHKLNSSHNDIIDPDQLEVDENVLIFYVENQAVWNFGIRVEDLKPGIDNPTVYKGYYEEHCWDWSSYKMSTFDFVQLMIYLQAAWGALDYGFMHSAKEAIDAIEGTWEKVVEAEDLHIWKHEGILLSHLDGEASCRIAGQDTSALKKLQIQFGLSEDDGERLLWV